MEKPYGDRTWEGLKKTKNKTKQAKQIKIWPAFKTQLAVYFFRTQTLKFLGPTWNITAAFAWDRSHILDCIHLETVGRKVCLTFEFKCCQCSKYTEESYQNAIPHATWNEMKSLDCVVNQPLPTSWNSVTVLENFSWDPDLKKTHKSLIITVWWRNVLITGSFLKGILDKDSFSIRRHTVEKWKGLWEIALMYYITLLQVIKINELICQSHLMVLDLLAGLISSPPKPLQKKYTFNMTKQHLDTFFLAILPMKNLTGWICLPVQFSVL